MQHDFLNGGFILKCNMNPGNASEILNYRNEPELSVIFSFSLMLSDVNLVLSLRLFQILDHSQLCNLPKKTEVFLDSLEINYFPLLWYFDKKIIMWFSIELHDIIHWNLYNFSNFILARGVNTLNYVQCWFHFFSKKNGIHCPFLLSFSPKPYQTIGKEEACLKWVIGTIVQPQELWEACAICTSTASNTPSRTTNCWLFEFHYSVRTNYRLAKSIEFK